LQFSRILAHQRSTQAQKKQTSGRSGLLLL
jgi:hypothetical protein